MFCTHLKLIAMKGFISLTINNPFFLRSKSRAIATREIFELSNICKQNKYGAKLWNGPNWWISGDRRENNEALCLLRMLKLKRKSLTVKCQETFRIKIYIAIIEVRDAAIFFSDSRHRKRVERSRLELIMSWRTGLIMFWALITISLRCPWHNGRSRGASSAE